MYERVWIDRVTSSCTHHLIRGAFLCQCNIISAYIWTWAQAVLFKIVLCSINSRGSFHAAQVRRTEAFADACSELLSGAHTTSLIAGPCTVSPVLIEAASNPTVGVPTATEHGQPRRQVDSSNRPVQAIGIEVGSHSTPTDAAILSNGSIFSGSIFSGSKDPRQGEVAAESMSVSSAGIHNHMAAVASISSLPVTGADAAEHEHAALSNSSNPCSSADVQKLDAAHGKEASNAELREAGEGFGPRKELFALVAGSMTCTSGDKWVIV